ncbi:hypothetical protein BBO99_00002451 [Phytophthora kernoviae]|uniref:BD-FAE-like domain-containing protein n=2 Tax=Phytophthora kernoviae TaxID=325452 RepID=A0A421F988_9STRA|nr:hypothetical protein G195_004209 [Phytophthora kernoviae 00238/432]KAG2527115.1 hypothetical protein JM16_001922 [Phytophthora kernoviae]KAG2528564.1 hypothetical protein JM18_002024 [Phytophthora kernoviae]RLN31839.1 hypothetical protein BBI17_000521 [Phytophthora kernoviae]RLN83040.1 hypothetical protein BBO99_00002451 [Phytophthora kernoviae]
MLRRTLLVFGAYKWQDVAYVSEPHALQKLDIAIPRKIPPRAKLPTCVFVHGGSWQRGDKNGGLNSGIDEAFVSAGGCLGVSVNYRLSPEVQHPEHVKDVAAAITWVHHNVAKFGGDPTKLVLVGHSAGAHLVMQILADPAYLQEAGMKDPVDTFVRGAVGISGVYNITNIQRHVVPDCNHFTIVQHLAEGDPDVDPTMKLIKAFVNEVADPEELSPLL